ncbi:hypothetical protein O6H91_03G107800 [Diphasiastrum complanatum]|uniref:Uncharacterized protein n=2 Tax=Diphasiastrum complanatum TaxID=34168 RepID=A0ACC2EA44_DIPCM|nr:hypothetical protein O6H91_Y190500 [Diphasiastrum complanatum]KAJ7563378.1 hypothetical protein O6H91_03G107800 [Diphasiastrum complanatum]KAJ7563379.1 hypothetical protein O6H91_03G107800 [Diphasiastrum complanatum]
MLDHRLDLIHQGSFMGAKTADMCKVQVIYYLNRAGKMEPPHMMEVLTSSPNVLRLKDVKRRLNFLRGSGMSNLFSWSYKRNYRSKYIWQDLSDDDVIDPGNGGEYILKGSEILDDNQEKSLKPGVSQLSECRKQLEVLQSKYRGAEIWLKPESRRLGYDHLNISSESKSETEEKSSCSRGQSSGSCISYDQKEHSIHNENLSDNKPEIEICEKNDQSSTGCKGSSSSEDSVVSSQFHDIKVYKIKPVSGTADYSCDAATQTERTARRAYKNAVLEQSTPSPETSTELKQTVISKEEKLHVAKSPYSNATAGKTASHQNQDQHQKKDQIRTITSRKESISNVKLKQNASSWVFLHVLSCGSVDTKLQNKTPNTEVKTSNYQELDARSSSEVQEMMTAQASPSQEGESFKLISRSSSFSSRSATSLELQSKLDRKIKEISSVGTSEYKRYSSKGIGVYNGSKGIGVSTMHVKSSNYQKDHAYVPWIHQQKEAACIEYRACI